MAMECVMHGCDVLNKRSCACQTEHTLVYSYRSVLEHEWVSEALNITYSLVLA